MRCSSSPGYGRAACFTTPASGCVRFYPGRQGARSPARRALYGSRCLRALTPCTSPKTAHLPANEIRDRISAEMNGWIGDAEQYDDLTFIVMKVR